MPCEFRRADRVEFSDTDLAGIVHFSNYFRYMERAEHAFLRTLGFSVHMQFEGRTIGWPRVQAECSYRKPLRFEDELEVHLLVRQKKEKSLTYEFIFRKREEDALEEVARGTITAVCVELDPETRKLRAIPIPEALAAQLEVAPEP